VVRKVTSIRLEGISKSFSGVKALEAIDLKIEPGELFTLLGPSGCGKTTLLLAAGGLQRPDAGRVMLRGEDPYALTPEARAAWRAASRLVSHTATQTRFVYVGRPCTRWLAA
jgi:ABC-type Fe3+/spermidine/putrescine transport system ATPase subunit